MYFGNILLQKNKLAFPIFSYKLLIELLFVILFIESVIGKYICLSIMVCLGTKVDQMAIMF